MKSFNSEYLILISIVVIGRLFNRSLSREEHLRLLNFVLQRLLILKFSREPKRRVIGRRRGVCIGKEGF